MSSSSFIIFFAVIWIHSSIFCAVVLLTPELQRVLEMRLLQSWIQWKKSFPCPVSYTVLCAPQKTIDCLANSLLLSPHFTFEDPPKSSEIHLVWTVEDHYIFSKAPSHIFHSFSFSSSCRSHRCSTHVHAQSLSQSDVTSKRQQSNRLQQTDFCIVSVEYRGTYTRCDLKGKGKCWNYIPLITIWISKKKTPSLSLWYREY